MLVRVMQLSLLLGNPHPRFIVVSSTLSNTILKLAPKRQYRQSSKILCFSFVTNEILAGFLRKQKAPRCEPQGLKPIVGMKLTQIPEK